MKIMDRHCCICNAPAKWWRITKNSEAHPFCNTHAKEQVCFRWDFPYLFWTNTPEIPDVGQQNHGM